MGTNAGSDGRKGENQCEQVQRQSKHDWDDAGGGDDKNRVQMINDQRDDIERRSSTHRWCDHEVQSTHQLLATSTI